MGVSTEQEQARKYIEEKRKGYQERIQNLTRKQRILRILISLALCIIIPFIGVCIQVIVEQYSHFKINPTVVIVGGFGLAIMLVNWKNPAFIMFYEWIGLAGGLLLSLIIGLIIGIILDEILLQLGYPAADLSLPLIVILMATLSKLKAKHIPSLISKKSILTIVQFLSIGFAMGRIAGMFFKQTGYVMLIIGVICTLITMLLKRLKILVNYRIVLSLVGVFSGIALSGLF